MNIDHHFDLLGCLPPPSSLVSMSHLPSASGPTPLHTPKPGQDTWNTIHGQSPRLASDAAIDAFIQRNAREKQDIWRNLGDVIPYFPFKSNVMRSCSTLNIALTQYFSVDGKDEALYGKLLVRFLYRTHTPNYSTDMAQTYHAHRDWTLTHIHAYSRISSAFSRHLH